MLPQSPPRRACDDDVVTVSRPLGEGVAIRAARLFDGSEFRANPVLLLREGSIVSVGEAPPESVRVVELGDVTLMPGLIDTHQHLVFDGQGTLEEQVSGVDDALLERRARDAARVALSAGVTTLRDLGDRNFVSLSLRGDPDLPTILAAGPPLTRVGGHCSYLGGECTGVEELLGAVRERVERGCDAVKVMVTGGVLTPAFPIWETQFSSEEIAAVVAESHRLGLPVAAHCHGVAGIEQALDAGADSIEHCTFATAAGRSEPADEVVQRLASSGVAVSATLGRLPGEPLPPIVVANTPIITEMLGRLHATGGTVVVGTDAGISPAKPHGVLPYALADLIVCGFTPVEGLRALTSTAARVCGVGNRKGRLAPGFDADLITVDGNPAEDPAALTAVVNVWKDGRELEL